MQHESAKDAGNGKARVSAKRPRNESRPSPKAQQHAASDPLEIYLGEIKKNPILTRAEELRWAQKFDEARRRKVVLPTALGAGIALGGCGGRPAVTDAGVLQPDNGVQTDIGVQPDMRLPKTDLDIELDSAAPDVGSEFHGAYGAPMYGVDVVPATDAAPPPTPDYDAPDP